MSKSKNHLFSLDLLRGIAIVLMFITHGTRLYLSEVKNFKILVETSMLDSFLNFFLIIEPFTSALFLFLVGYSLSLSKQTFKGENWALKNLKRSGELYLIGFIFFFLEKGFQWPDLFLSPSILSCIAISIVSLTALIELNKNYLWVVTTIGVFAISFLIEDKYLVTGLNGGFGGVFPLILFSFLGYYTSKASNKNMFFLIGLSAIFWLVPGKWVAYYPTFYKAFPTGETGLDFIKYLISGGEVVNYKITFWNHTVLSVLRLMSPILLSFFILQKYQEKLKLKVYHQQLALLGRNSLVLYVYHLTFIAVFSLLGWVPKNAIQAWSFIGLIVGCALILSRKKEK